MEQVLAIRVGAKIWAVGHSGAHCLEEVVTYCTFRFDRRSGRRSPLGWAALGSHLQTKIWHFGQAFAT